LAEVDQVPKARVMPAPHYPYELRQVGIKGEVVIGFVVDTKGNTREVQVLKANDPRFGAAAAESISQWRFVPGRKAGQLVNVRMSVPIVFSFND
jgi:protein TonB